MPSTRKPSRLESTLSWAALGVLALAAIWVWQAHLTPNPALRSIPAPQAGQLAAPSPTSSTPAPAAGLTALLPPELAPLSPAESFNDQTVADKINGKAELYLSAGFKSLEAQRFNLKNAQDKWLEAFVYDQGDLAGAFAVFSQQRRPGAASLDLGPYAYQSKNGLFLAHGPYYLEIIAALPDPELMKAARDLAQNFVSRTPVKQKEIPELALFPREGLVPDSLSYLAKDAFGFSGADRVYVANYQTPAGPLTAFISHRKDPEQAAALAKAFAEFWVTAGGKALPSPPELPSARVIDLLGISEVIFSQGPFTAGVHQAEDSGAALELAKRLKAALEKAAP